MLIGHESKYGEDNKTGEKGGQTVAKGDQNGITMAIVVEFVVTGQGDNASKSG